MKPAPKDAVIEEMKRVHGTVLEMFFIVVIGRHGNIVGGSNQRSHGSYKYRHSTQRSSVSSIQCSTDIENKDRNVVLDSEEKEENRLSLSMESAMLNPVCIQTKRFRNGGGIRKRSYSFSEGM